MKGRDALIAMRHARRVPDQLVFVLTSGDFLPDDNANPAILIEPNETPVLCDLRCLVGLMVDVGGSEKARVWGAYQSAVRGGARLVVATLGKRMWGMNEEGVEWHA